jgi:hypothetical protein
MPAVLFYVQHLLGIGHLMRARVIAEALADGGCDVHLVTGGRALGGRLPRGVGIVQLPPIHVTDAEMKPLRDADGQPIDDAYRERRRSLLLAAFDAVAPAAVVFETFPFGRRLHFEPCRLRSIGQPRPLAPGLGARAAILRRRGIRPGAKCSSWRGARSTRSGSRRPSLHAARRSVSAAPQLGIRSTTRVSLPHQANGAAPTWAEAEVIVIPAAGGGLRISARRSTRALSCRSPWLLVGTNASNGELEHLADAGPA